MSRILLTGKNGQVGWELQRTLAPLGRVIALDRTQMDLTNPDSIRQTIRDAVPDIIVNAAAYTAVDTAEAEPELAMQVNAVAPGIMAEEAKRLGALLVHYSTDYVFDGTKQTPYVEEDAPCPLNAYGRSKLEGEYTIAATGCTHLILRTSWIYAERGANFMLTILELARQKKALTVVDDQIGCPTWARFIAESTTKLLADVGHAKNNQGIYHLSADGQTSRFDFARKIIELAAQLSGQNTGWAEIHPTTTAEYPLPAQRPLNCATRKDKISQTFGLEMQSWGALLSACLEDYFDKATSKRDLVI